MLLRDLCSKLDISVHLWSGVERGLCPPPSDVEFLVRCANLFGLEGTKRLEFLSSAARACGTHQSPPGPKSGNPHQALHTRA